MLPLSDSQKQEDNILTCTPALATNPRISEKIWHTLRCPLCLGVLQEHGVFAECQQCGEKYQIAPDGQLDLRLKKNKGYLLEMGINSFLDSTYDLNIDNDYWKIPFTTNNLPEVDFGGMKIPIRLNRFQLSHFPKATQKGCLVLDLGCGEGVHREVCEHAGFEYVGVDIRHEKAHILGDAHALPFADDSFDFILSIATLEHLRNPFIAIREAHRVLKPGARLLGSVAFLEPFHDLSYFHHSHHAINYLLQDANFCIKAIGPEADWPVLKALTEMILFPKLPKSAANAIVAPIHLLHRLWWKIGAKLRKSETAQERYRLLATTGSLTFVVEKK
jgi:SAM-dependent methyltransferase